MIRVRLLFPTLFAISAPALATVTVTSPANNQTVSSPARYVASASAPSCAQGVASMGVYVDNQLASIVNGSALNTTVVLSPGAHSTVVQEWDSCGGASTTPIEVTVVNHAAVSVSSPLNKSTVSSPVTFLGAATTACAQGVAAMGVYVANQLAYKADGASLDTSIALNPGSYSTVVQSWDNCGAVATTPVSFTVAAHPGVTVTSPANNSTVSSPVSYVASATTACAKGVASMGIYVNNQLTYLANGESLDTALSLNPGKYDTVVQEWDYCGEASSTSVDLTVAGTPAKSLTAISVLPNPASFAAGSTDQLTAKAIYTDGSTADVTSAVEWTIANSAVASVSASGSATGLASGSTTATASLNGVSGSAPVNVTLAPGAGVSIATWHADTNRSGLNAKETSLSPSNVSARTFGKLFSYAVDGYVYGQPLLMSNVTTRGAAHNVLYAATEKDSVYAFDADAYGSGAPLWQVSLLEPGETPMTNGPIRPYQGVTSTPVIDTSSNTMYVVSTQVSGANSTFRLNALDITTGAQKFGGPVTIEASVVGTNSDSVNGRVALTTACVQRSALLLANGNVYVAFGGCHSGWLLAYNAHILTQTAVFNASPNLNGEGAYASAGGIWMGGGGPVADSAGNIYVTTGNGPWDGKTAWGDSVLKFNAALQLEDSFTPDSYAYMNCNDTDLGGGGLLLVPGTSQALAGGKSGKLYLLNTSNLGKEQANDAGATQTLWFESDLVSPYTGSCTDSAGTHTAELSSYEIFGTAAYFNGSAYLGVTPTAAVPAGVRRFSYSGTLAPDESTSAGVQQSSMGTTPFVSAEGASNGIVWFVDHGHPLQNAAGSAPTSAVLRAYDASNLQLELYSSDVNAGDAAGYGIKFSSPIVGNGKVYFATGLDPATAANPRGEVDVYGLK